MNELNELLETDLNLRQESLSVVASTELREYYGDERFLHRTPKGVVVYVHLYGAFVSSRVAEEVAPGLYIH